MNNLDLDLSRNNLAIIPDHVYRIKTLRRLNLSQNCLSDLAHEIGKALKQIGIFYSNYFNKIIF